MILFSAFFPPMLVYMENKSFEIRISVTCDVIKRYFYARVGSWTRVQAFEQGLS